MPNKIIVLILIITPLLLHGQDFDIKKYEDKIVSFDGQNATLSNDEIVSLALAENDTLLVLTRHGEKVDQSRNPQLSEAGKLRAENLKKIFANAPIFDVVYSSKYYRTVNTIRPYCKSKSIKWKIYDPKKPDSLIALLKSYNTALIVGHSNTIPKLINHLTGTDLPEFVEEDYNNLVFIKIPNKGAKTIYFFQY